MKWLALPSNAYIIRDVSLFRAIKMVREYYVLTVSPIYLVLTGLDKEKNISLQKVEKVSIFCEEPYK